MSPARCSRPSRLDHTSARILHCALLRTILFGAVCASIPVARVRGVRVGRCAVARPALAEAPRRGRPARAFEHRGHALRGEAPLEHLAQHEHGHVRPLLGARELAAEDAFDEALLPRAGALAARILAARPLRSRAHALRAVEQEVVRDLASRVVAASARLGGGAVLIESGESWPLPYYLRALRNLNPRYEPTDYIPQGTVMRAPKRVVDLYRNQCVQGERAILANQLVNASKYVPPSLVGTPEGAQLLTSAPAPGKAKSPTRTREHRVKRGDSLMAIAREYSCDLTVLAKENRLKGPNYMLKPGQRLKLKGCEG